MGNEQSGKPGAQNSGRSTTPPISGSKPRKSTKNHNNPTAAVGVNSTTPASHAADENSESTARPVVKMAASAQSFTGSVGGGHRKDADGIMITDALTDVREKYHIEAKELGHGHYGVVRKCMNRETKEWLAIKSIRKAKVSKIEVLKREIEILKEVSHPNIIQLVDVYEDAKYLHLITELCTGGELFDRIIAKTKSREGHFSEHDAAKLIRDILDAIAYCHDKQIVHRDLKPENFLYKTEAEDSPIKIIDFGLSRHDDQDFGIMKTKVGTPYYVAPEVLNREYTNSCDVWSIGVIAYILLCGYPPFYGDSDYQIFESVRVAQFDFPSPDWDDISDSAKDFVCCLLKKKPQERLTAREAMHHRWLLEQLGDDANVVNRNTIQPSSRRSITFKKYIAMQKLKKAALGYIAANLSETEVGSLGDIFHSLDKDNDGFLTLSDLDSAISKGNFPAQLQHDLKDLREYLELSGEDALNWRAFLAATMDKKLVMREDKIRMAFNHFKHSDTNFLTRADLVDLFDGEAQLQDVMPFLDADGDGRVSFEDFQHAIKETIEEDM